MLFGIRKYIHIFGIVECLSGMPVEVEFISFDDILENGIPEDTGVIINALEMLTLLGVVESIGKILN